MKKIFIKVLIGLILGFTILNGSSSIEAKTSVNTINNQIQNSNYEETTQLITEQTQEEILEGQNKMKLAEEYSTQKKLSKNYGTLKTLSSYKTAVQEQGHWCGPAAAYNATNAAANQLGFANFLGTSKTNGTPFPGSWASTLNFTKPGNNYVAIKASDYSDWRAKLKDAIIYTIDKGYAVIADCLIKSNDSSTWIHSNYSYVGNRGYDCYHYVAVVGYDDNPNTIPAEVLIVDSNTNQTLPIKYWTTVDKLKAATESLGIVW